MARGAARRFSRWLFVPLKEKGMRWVWIIVGVLALATGVLWTLQGLNIVKGSVMTGQSIYVIIGPIVALVGLTLLFIGLRQRPSAS
jgi:hypothetical protein